MSKHYFYNITRKIIVQFLDIFNGITIAKYNDVGRVKKYVKVPVKFAPKTKQWYWNELKENQDRRDLVFPMISINLENIEYDSERQVNRNFKVSSFTDSVSSRRFYNPVPYNFNFKVLIVSQYMVDITQIVEQILPNFAPESYIRITVPELNIVGQSSDTGDNVNNLDLRVVYEGSQKDTPVELDEESFRVITWEMTFSVQGYMFTPMITDSSNKVIHKIIHNYYTSEEGWNNRGNDLNTPAVMNIRMYTVPYADIYYYPLSVQIRSFDHVDEIYYSLDGSVYQLYTVPIVLHEPTTIWYHGVNTTDNTTSPHYQGIFL